MLPNCGAIWGSAERDSRSDVTNDWGPTELSTMERASTASAGQRTRARVAKLADALDLGSSVFGRGGSSPPLRTTKHSAFSDAPQ